MQVRNGDFFHIHRTNEFSSRWKVGSAIFWGQKEPMSLYP
jgi:hypothetical protein